MIDLHPFVDGVARVIEYLGVAVVVLGVILASVIFLREGLSARDWRCAYGRYRANLGRGILIGLELLVAADIIATVTAPLTPSSVGLLAAVVLIRTFLSFSLETEIEGRWPWKRAAAEAKTPEIERR
jgi:uncharacterized membrane protein